MRKKADKKEDIRAQIIDAAQCYRDNLAGKVFLYVVGDEYFEVVFQTDRFMHLTGVNSYLSAKDFYEKAKSSSLTAKQFCFDEKHPHRVAKKKLPCLLKLPALTNSLVCVIKNLKTVTVTYTLGLTNLNFTIGLTENTDLAGNKINDWFLPRTLRVRDRSIENSIEAEFVDFIFSKDASVDKIGAYDAINYWDKNKTIPHKIVPLLSQRVIDTCTCEQSIHLT